MKKWLLALTLVIASAVNALATHIVGGNIIIDQTAANTFTITVKVYRDCCPSCSTLPPTIQVGIYNKSNNATQQVVNIGSPVMTPIALGDECYTPTGICVQEGVYSLANIIIPDNAAGYYIETELFARNNIIDNIQNPGGTGMSFYAEIPDPAILNMNDSPDFGPYPSDGYFCVNNTKILDFGVIDPDGDSLVYSLVDPLDSNLGGNGTSAAPYSPVSWMAPFSLANIVGGTPAMSINTATGEISATPSALGTYVFAVRIEEYRNGVKIGEVRRDVQYHALNCVFDDLPEIQLPDSMFIAVGSTGCFDVVVLDADATDTISILVSSPVTFADGATIGMPAVPVQVVPDTLYQFYYTNLSSGLPDSVSLAPPVDTGGAYYGIGGIGLHYCWETSCQDIIGNPYELEVSAFSLGCSGDTNFINQTVQLIVVPVPIPEQEIYVPDSVQIVAQFGACFDIVVLSDDPSDTVNIVVNGPTFAGGASLTLPTPVSTNPNMYEYFFWNTNTFAPDSVILPQATLVNGAYTSTQGVGLRYCWTPDCDYIQEAAYNIGIQSFKIGCFGDTASIYENTLFVVNPPDGEAGVVPNVFTPNGDKVNDEFMLDGIYNYCYDTINVKIYNRWGELVFESDNPEFKWDGKFKNGREASDGIYYVAITGIFGDVDVTRHYTLHLLRNK